MSQDLDSLTERALLKLILATMAANQETNMTALDQAVADINAALTSAQTLETGLLNEIVTAINNLNVLVAQLADNKTDTAALETLVPQIQAGVTAAQTSLANLQAADQAVAAATAPPTPTPAPTGASAPPASAATAKS
jgi:ATP phosphoribosyltransferase